MPDLQTLVDRRLRDLGDRRGPLSARSAADRSGGKVSYETLRLIHGGQHSGRITPKVAEGLALALDVPLSLVYAAAQKRPPQGRFELPDRADTLTQRERQVVVSVVDAILAAHDSSGVVANDGPGLRAVARKKGQRGSGGR